MKHTLSRLGLLPPASWLVRGLLAVSLCWSAGCTSVNMNPSYFPYLFPTPYANYDPDLVRISVEPLADVTKAVRTQHVLLVTVYDKNNNPRRGRQVEFMISGAGSIIDVAPTRHLWRNKPDRQYAISETVCFEHLLTRGTGNEQEKIAVRPGQTWCVLTSPVEGDTQVTVFVPGIHNWDKRVLYTTIRWVDAGWEFPAPAQVRAGAAHVLTTKLVRLTDKQPLANYRVRYKIADGSAAVFIPSKTQEYTAVSDLSGLAQVAIMQTTPALGITKVSIEVVRPPDPNSPGGSGVTLAKGETTIEWLAPAVQLKQTGPSVVLAGSEATYEATVSNTGPVESQFVEVASVVPDGLQFLRSDPPAQIDGRTLTWPLGRLPAGQAHRPIRMTYKALRPGMVEHCVEATSDAGIKDRKCMDTSVTTAGLKIGIRGPSTATIGQPLLFNVTLSNPGGGPVSDIVVTASFSSGLEHENPGPPRQTSLGGTVRLKDVPPLAPQQTISLTPSLLLVARQPGPQWVKFTATAAAGGLSDQAQVAVTVMQPQLSLTIDSSPNTKYVGRPAEWRLTLSNSGDSVLNNVVVRDRLPPELQFTGAGQEGRNDNGEVVWNVAGLQPREKRILRVFTQNKEAGQGIIHSATATAEPGIREQAQTRFNIINVPSGIQIELGNEGNPVAVGKTITYTVRVLNTGKQPLNQVELKAIVPAELKIVRAQGPPGSKEPLTAGQTITFAPVNGVGKDRPQEYRIEAEALRRGDVRFRIELRTQGREPIPEEMQTTIYDAGVAPPGPMLK